MLTLRDGNTVEMTVCVDVTVETSGTHYVLPGGSKETVAGNPPPGQVPISRMLAPHTMAPTVSKEAHEIYVTTLEEEVGEEVPRLKACGAITLRM